MLIKEQYRISTLIPNMCSTRMAENTGAMLHNNIHVKTVMRAAWWREEDEEEDFVNA